MTVVVRRTHRRKLGKMLGGSQSIWDWGTIPRTAKDRVGVGMEGDWIGFGVGFCLDCLEWGMKIVGREKV